jgi:iron complex transport system substrate-binding protein
MMKRRSFLHYGAAIAAPFFLPGLARSAPSNSLISVYGQLPASGQLRRIYPAGPPAAVLLSVLAPTRMIGWPQSLPAQSRNLLDPAVRDLPHLGRLAGRGSTLSLEALVGHRPDCIIDVGTVDETYRTTAARVAQQTGIPYVLIGGRLADSAQQLREVGALLDIGARAEQLARYAEETLALAAARRATADANPDKRIGVYLARGADGLETGLLGSINTEVIEFVGARNVADAGGRGNLARCSIEQLLLWNPDVIVTQDAAVAARIAQDPLWAQLNAVKHKRILLAPAEPFGWVDGPPGINRLIGVRWLLAMLYGTPSSDTIPALATAFYQQFYGTAPSMAVPTGIRR